MALHIEEGRHARICVKGYAIADDFAKRQQDLIPERLVAQIFIYVATRQDQTEAGANAGFVLVSYKAW